MSDSVMRTEPDNSVVFKSLHRQCARTAVNAELDRAPELTADRWEGGNPLCATAADGRSSVFFAITDLDARGLRGLDELLSPGGFTGFVPQARTEQHIALARDALAGEMEVATVGRFIDRSRLIGTTGALGLALTPERYAAARIRKPGATMHVADAAHTRAETITLATAIGAGGRLAMRAGTPDLPCPPPPKPERLGAGRTGARPPAKRRLRRRAAVLCGGMPTPLEAG